MKKDDAYGVYHDTPMSQEFLDIADQYEGNLLNYFCGMSPKQSKRFNKMVKDSKKNK